jgi:outer membrane protein assembly factor BamA
MSVSRILSGIISFAIFALLWGCSSTKFVGEGEYLLDKVVIKSDIKDIPVSELKEYRRQTPNTFVLGLFRTQLGIYNLSPKDTTGKWNRFWSRTFRNMGEPPVILDPILTQLSAQQLQLLYINRGYINAVTDTNLVYKGKKVKVEYNIHSNKPYKVRNYSTISNHTVFDSIASDTARSSVRKGMNFDTDILNQERERITSRMRNLGYYNFIKDFIVYSADSSLKSNQVDVKLDIKSNLKNNSAPINWLVFRQYYVGKVYFVLNKTGSTDTISTQQTDTVSFRNYYLIDTKNKFVELDALIHNSFIEPNSLYNDLAVERTYSALNTLAPIKYVNISFKETEVPDVLDSYIYIVPAKIINVSAEVEGTLTKGYLGGALQLGYINKNQFKGAETLTLQGRMAVEKQNLEWAQELSGQVRLMFPKFLFPFGSYDFKRNVHANTEYTTNISYQNRPNEFTTSNLTGGMNYSWAKTKYRHKFELFNLSYVYFPKIDDNFRTTYINPGIYNKYNYEDHFIMRMGYNGSVSGFNPSRPLRNYTVTNYNFESAGNFLYLANKILDTPKEADGFYKLFNVRYSQYLRAEYNTSYYQIFDKNNRLVYHVGVGAGLPFGNANIIPYERRFYSGGANSVRGWRESELGPGVYQRIESSRDYNQVGDLKLDLNMEYRTKLFWLIEGALFLDAGNVWTIKDYSTEQPGGQFQLDSFYKQIALSYGAGMRLDFSFFIFRFDMGVRLFNPVELPTERWRFSPNWADDFRFHVGIGYPF